MPGAAFESNPTRDVGRHPEDVEVVAAAFLQGALAVHLPGHLSRQEQHGNSVRPGGGEAGHRVGDARAGRDEDDGDLSGGARVAAGREHRAGLVLRGDDLDLGVVEQRVEDRRDGPAGETEHHLHPALRQDVDEDVRRAACRGGAWAEGGRQLFDR
jgi:hypothetical protein